MEIVLVVLLLIVLFACFSAAVASARGYSAVTWFFVGLLFGPFGFRRNLGPSTSSSANRT